MRAGRLDRQVTIQQNVPTRGTAGSEVDNWENVLATVWAQKIDQGGREYAIAGAQRQAELATIWRIRYLATITNKMRLRYGGVDYEIENIKELGRREGLELLTHAKVD